MEIICIHIMIYFLECTIYHSLSIPARNRLIYTLIGNDSYNLRIRQSHIMTCHDIIIILLCATYHRAPRYGGVRTLVTSITGLKDLWRAYQHAGTTRWLKLLNTNFLSPPVLMHGELLCVTFLSVCLSVWVYPGHIIVISVSNEQARRLVL